MKKNIKKYSKNDLENTVVQYLIKIENLKQKTKKINTI